MCCQRAPIPLSDLVANYTVWQWLSTDYRTRDYTDATRVYRELRNKFHDLQGLPWGDAALLVQVWATTYATDPDLIHEHAVRHWGKDKEQRYQRLKAMQLPQADAVDHPIKRKLKTASVSGFQLEDMISAGRDIGLRLNNAQAYEILGELASNFDAETGVNWTVIRETISWHKWEGEKPWRWSYQDEVWLTGTLRESEWEERSREIWSLRSGDARSIEMCLTLESGAVVEMVFDIPANTPESLVEAVALTKVPKTLASGQDSASNLAVKAARVRVFRPEIDQEEPPVEPNAEIEIKVDAREFAAILAGLRLLEIHKDGEKVGWREWRDILAIADDNYELKPLEIQEIDELAKRINISQYTYKETGDWT